MTGVPLVALAATTTDPILLGLVLGLILSVWPLYNAVVVSRWMRQVPDALMGRVQSAVALIGWAPVPLAPLLGGLLIEWVGAMWTVLIFAAIMAMIAVAATLNSTVRAEAISRHPAGPIRNRTPSPMPPRSRRMMRA